MKLIPILILSIFLTGCACFKKPEEPSGITTKPVEFKPEVLEHCSLLKENLVLKTFDDTLVAYSDLVTSYVVCANKQSTSVKLLKEIGNVK